MAGVNAAKASEVYLIIDSKPFYNTLCLPNM